MKNQIKGYRAMAGISCRELGEIAGFSQQSISRYENGIRNPGLKECRAIVAAFNEMGDDATLDEVFPEELI